MPVMYGKYRITIPNNMRGIYKMKNMLHEDSERRWWNEMLRVTDAIHNMEERRPTTYFWTKGYKEYKFVISLGTSCSYHFSEKGRKTLVREFEKTFNAQYNSHAVGGIFSSLHWNIFVDCKFCQKYMYHKLSRILPLMFEYVKIREDGILVL